MEISRKKQNHMNRLLRLKLNRLIGISSIMISVAYLVIEIREQIEMNREKARIDDLSDQDLADSMVGSKSTA
jgi:hypothetical protein